MKHLYIESGWVNALVRAFTRLGLDAKKLTSDLPGFESCQFVIGQRIEVSAARKLWHRATDMMDDPLLGLKVGLSLDYRSVGVLMPIIWHSPSARVALSNILRFQKLISESGIYKLTERDGVLDENATGRLDNGYIECEYVAAQNIVPINPHQALSVIVGTIGIIEGITSNRVKVKHLSLPPSLDAKLISAQLGCKVISKEGNLSVCFATQYFDELFAGCDEYLYELNKSFAEEVLRSKNESIALIDSVKCLIEKNGFARASIEAVESQLGMHKRTLQRNLSEQGTSYRQLKEEVLKEQAVNQLVRQKLEVETIAQNLGYSEPSAFHRAFKAWFGVSPKKFIRY